MKFKTCNFYLFLCTFNDLGVACRQDIYRVSKLSIGTVRNCMSASIRGKLLVGVFGDCRQYNYKLTEDGKEMLRLLSGMVSNEL